MISSICTYPDVVLIKHIHSLLFNRPNIANVTSPDLDPEASVFIKSLKLL